MPISISLETCSFTKEQLITLLADNVVRKIILQFANDASSKTILVAYGLEKDNDTKSGPVYSTVAPNTTGIPIPAGGILGNLIIRRGQLKKLFGYREGRHERIPDDKIEAIILRPQSTLVDYHVWYKLNTMNHTLAADLEVKPSPPARPCRECESSSDES